MTHRHQVGDEPVPGSGYRLVRFLGRGGFGEVWQASGPGGTDAAIKLIELGSGKGDKEFRALQLVKRIRHPNLVPIIAFWLRCEDGTIRDGTELVGTPSGLAETDAHGAVRETLAPPSHVTSKVTQLILAMGLGDKSLFDRLEECREQGLRGIPRDELLRYMEHAAEAIDFLNRPQHDLGEGPVAIQHCDIKPHNVMIVGGATQICDFGLARMISSVLATTTASGTVAYAAPEFLRGGKASHASDQYSLAITYYELATGRLPYQDETYFGVAHAVAQGNLDLDALPEPERAVIRRATALEPDARFASAGDMVRALRSAQTGEAPAAALPPRRQPKPSPRRALPGMVKVLVTIAAVAGVAVGVWFGILRPAGNGTQAPVGSGGGKEVAESATGKAGLGKEEDRVGSDDGRSGARASPLAEAQTLMRSGQWPEAIEALDRAIATGPANATAYLLRGRCHRELGNLAQAISDFEKALEQDREDEDAKAELAASLLQRGTRALEQGQDSGAVADFDRAEELGLSDPRLYSRRGAARFRLEQWNEALADFTAAVRAEPDARDLVNRGRTLRHLERIDEACADLEQARKLAPESADAAFWLGDTLLLGDRPEHAVPVLDDAIRLAGEEKQPGFAVGDAFFRRGLGRLLQENASEAIDDLTEAIRRDTAQLLDAYDLRATALEHLGQTRLAACDRRIVGLLKRLAAAPDDAAAHAELAMILAASPNDVIRDGSKALELARRACELTSWSDVAALNALAAACAETGQFEEAVRWAEKALELLEDERTKQAAEVRLDHYRAGKPYRTSPSGSPPEAPRPESQGHRGPRRASRASVVIVEHQPELAVELAVRTAAQRRRVGERD